MLSEALESWERFWKYILSKLYLLSSLRLPTLLENLILVSIGERNLYFSKCAPCSWRPSALGVWEPLKRNGPGSGVMFAIEGRPPVTSSFPCVSPWLESPRGDQGVGSELQPRQQWPCESCSWPWAPAACLLPAFAISVWRWEARMNGLSQTWGSLSEDFLKERHVFNRLF